MAANFIVEDGTGVAGANSYVPVAYADQYFLDRNNASWTGDSATVKQPALVQATDYLTTRFLLNPCKVPDLGGPAQVPPLVVPDKLMRAVCEYAVRALTGSLLLDPITDPTGRAVTGTTETVGPITETVSYQPGASINLFKPYPAADLLLRGLTLSSQGKVIRG